MRASFFAAALAVASIGFSGCAASEGDVGVTEGELSGGCQWNCPRCRPGQMCPMRACFLECHGQGDEHRPTPCGDNLCAPGDYCCNPSCGICAPFGAACIQIACAPPTTGGCQTDADCRTFSDYCTGCDCRALSTSEPDPICDGPGVRCLVDPCGASTAVCNTRTGACELAAR